MENNNIPIHFVGTPAEALKLIEEHSEFFVSNCGCRERKGKCERSRMDVCLMFYGDTVSSGSGKKKISKEQALEILNEAKGKFLVPRPFRSEDRSFIEGICFCCDDCCSYFECPEETCDKGQYISVTDNDICNHCGNCVDVCYFSSRIMNETQMVYDENLCYGCGLCADACALECIEMTAR
jgi:Pyruvate/2-oxoacid:ferredoxin oxidoreductase delta subunit